MLKLRAHGGSWRWSCVVGAIVLTAITTIFLWLNYQQAQTDMGTALSARSAFVEILSELKDCETGVRGFLLTGEESFLEPYDLALPKVQSQLEGLRRIADGDASQQASTERVIRLVHRKLEFLAQLVAGRRTTLAKPASETALLDQGKRTMDALRAEIARMLQREDQWRAESEQVAAATKRRLEWLMYAVFTCSTLLAVNALRKAKQREAAV